MPLQVSDTMSEAELAEWERRLKANELFETGDPDSPGAAYSRRYRAWMKGKA